MLVLIFLVCYEINKFKAKTFSNTSFCYWTAFTKDGIHYFRTRFTEFLRWCGLVYPINTWWLHDVGPAHYSKIVWEILNSTYNCLAIKIPRNKSLLYLYLGIHKINSENLEILCTSKFSFYRVINCNFCTHFHKKHYFFFFQK